MKTEQPEHTHPERKRRRKWTGDGDSPWYRKYLVPAIIVVATTVTGSLITAYLTGAFTGNTMRAAMGKPTIEANVTLRDYLTLQKGPVTSYSEQQLSTPGYVVHARVQIEGFKGKVCTINGNIFDAETNERVALPFPWAENQFGTGLTSERLTDSATGFVWVPDLKLEKPFYVQLDAYDPKGTHLDTMVTDPIKPRAMTSPTPAVVISPSPSPKAEGSKQ